MQISSPNSDPQSSTTSTGVQLPSSPNHDLPFTAPWLLAPMDGVTDPVFREIVLGRNSAQHLGGAFTEFVRVGGHKIPARVMRRQLGPKRFDAPIGLQLMGSNLEMLAESARELLETDAPILDLNFGCPAKGALRGCAGSAVLKDPGMLHAIVEVCVRAVDGRIPVTAKIRAGYDDADRVEELAAAAQDAGAAMLTIHCRTRAEGYQDQVYWDRITRAVNAVTIPVCGNGSIKTHADLQRMRDETGCAYVMVGRASLADPWIFSGVEVERHEAGRFLQEYAQSLVDGGATLRAAASRVKQLVKYWTAGGLFTDDAERLRWMRIKSSEELLQMVDEIAQP
ncbi:MAG: tRNA-dihydrouridine synthase C [Planctomycetota bacterium]|jgi:tRNA-dihydrouridine synthase C